MLIKKNMPHMIGLLLAICVAPVSAHAVDFVHEVMPILIKHCSECHTGEKKKGGFAMNTRAQLLAGGESGKAVIPGSAAKSSFIAAITSKDKEEWMPPKGPRVSTAEIAILKNWIDQGVKWESGITLGKSGWEPPLKPRAVQLPPPHNGRSHPIDRLLDADLAKHKKPLPGSISDDAFLRRASLDAIGLLPSPVELDAFINNADKDKRNKVIAKLLDSDISYADHWLTVWNDLLRNDYTGTGFITGGRKQITTWLYASLRDNKPYNQLVEELISPTNESAGFINGIKWRGEVNSSQTRDIQFAQNISQVFLGINMKCASCHDSFIDRWTLSEAYNLASIYADKPLEINRCDKPTGKIATPKWIFPELGDIDPKASKSVRLKQLAKLMTHRDNGRFTRTVANRLWHRLMGRGIVHPVDAMHTKPWNEDLLDYLAVRFAADGYDLRKFIKFVMTSQAYQSQTMILQSEPGEDYVYAGPIAKRMTAEQLIDSIWQITGSNPTKPAGKVDRAERAKPATPKPAQKKRVAFGPVTSKWIWYPGATLAKKTNLRKSFTLTKAPESALLMATCDNAFSMKLNGKVVATSQDWTKPVYIDITKHFIKGNNKIEVNAEMFGGGAGFICQILLTNGDKRTVIITDQSWQTAKPGSKWTTAKVSFPHGQGPWKQVLNANAFNGDFSTTRALPAKPIRAALVKNDFLMRSLGRPHRDQVVTTRPGELTMLQAIDLSNGDILAGYLSSGAKRLIAQNKSNKQLIDWLYHFALSRKPTAKELIVLTQVAGDGRNSVAVEDLLWTVFMLPEFQMIR